MQQQFWELWGECRQNSVSHLGKKSYFTIFAFDSPERCDSPSKSGWKGYSGVVICQRTTALGMPVVLQTLKANFARECFCSVTVGFSGSAKF